MRKYQSICEGPDGEYVTESMPAPAKAPKLEPTKRPTPATLEECKTQLEVFAWHHHQEMELFYRIAIQKERTDNAKERLIRELLDELHRRHINNCVLSLSYDRFREEQKIISTENQQKYIHCFNLSPCNFCMMTPDARRFNASEEWECNYAAGKDYDERIGEIEEMKVCHPQIPCEGNLGFYPTWRQVEKYLFG